MTSNVDLLSLARDMLRRPSVTPRDAGALDVLEAALTRLGFTCHRLPFGAGESGREARVDNLYARLGSGKPHFCFAGHTDVVPPGDNAKWSLDPFAGEIKDGQLWGRGAADMKGAIAAFVAAADAFLRAKGKGFKGSISLLITGDEEGDAVNGTVKVLRWMEERGEVPDMRVVGEPTNPERLGDMIKIGRRGSMTGYLTVRGVQGHVAYPHLADNAAHRLVRMLDAVAREPLDAGSAHFQASGPHSTQDGKSQRRPRDVHAAERCTQRLDSCRTGGSGRSQNSSRDSCRAVPPERASRGGGAAGRRPDGRQMAARSRHVEPRERRTGRLAETASEGRRR
jgi:succinyl-diaminopimelate desuccinylase